MPLIGSSQIFYLIWGALLLALIAAHNLLGSRAGRAMRALRGGNTLVESLGINALQTRLATFVLAALLAALSGWLYAHMTRFVSPTPFDVTMSIEYLMMAMVGGSGYLLGALVGAALITLLKNWIQDVLPLIAPNTSGQLEIVVFSVLFIVFLQRARDGIVPYVAQWLPQPRHEKPVAAESLPRRAQPEKGGVLMTVEAASRSFGGLTAVNAVSFDVRADEILALIGPNGAGKTTMFNLITGALRASAGRIVFNGKDITRASACTIARAGIARTFQHVKLRPRMSLARQRAARRLQPHPRRTSSPAPCGSTAPRRIARAARRMRQLDRVGLDARPHELAGNLPLGNQRLLEIARALAADPVLLVLDEPAAGLRRPEKIRARRALAHLARRGPEHPAGRARHGLRHDPRRPRRGDGFRLQAVRRHARGGARRSARAGSLSRRRGVTSLLAIEKVCVRYGKAEAVRDVSLEVGRGQTATVIGPNGAGKTSLLTAAIGLLPCSGRVLFDGRDVTTLDTESRIEMGFCLVPERRELFSGMSVEDNLRLGAYSRRDGAAAIKQSMAEVFARFPRLNERRAQLAGTLSGGERQMLALGRALMAKPRLLMLDEPSLGLAPLIIREIFQIIASLRDLGVSILLVEQNARAALETADFGYVMEAGEIVHSGPSASLINDPRLIATYLGGNTSAKT